MSPLRTVCMVLLCFGCAPYEAVPCPDSGDRMGAELFGPNGASHARCNLACPDGALLGSREGMWAVSCWPGTCQEALLPDPDWTFCAYEEDVRAWKEAQCPECKYGDFDPTEFTQPPDEECEVPYRHVSLDCEMKL